MSLWFSSVARWRLPRFAQSLNYFGRSRTQGCKVQLSLTEPIILSVYGEYLQISLKLYRQNGVLRSIVLQSTTAMALPLLTEASLISSLQRTIPTLEPPAR